VFLYRIGFGRTAENSWRYGSIQDPVFWTYWRLGEPVAKAWRIGKKYKAKRE
jgi:hypothetical protein